MLTEKELEVLKLRKRGLKQAEIAEELSISQPAVSSFEQSIRRKVMGSLDILETSRHLGIKFSKGQKRLNEEER